MPPLHNSDDVIAHQETAFFSCLCDDYAVEQGYSDRRSITGDMIRYTTMLMAESRCDDN